MRGDGKRFDHQRRIQRRAIEAACSRLLLSAGDIAASQSFRKLLHIVEQLLHPIRGVGELYCYDTTARIGAFLRIEPDRVYLHAGTRAGARALGLSCKERWVLPTELPKELRGRSPREIENILCIYACDFASLPCPKRTQTRC
jgi:hypothetical protein